MTIGIFPGQILGENMWNCPSLPATYGTEFRAFSFSLNRGTSAIKLPSKLHDARSALE